MGEGKPWLSLQGPQGQGICLWGLLCPMHRAAPRHAGVNPLPGLGGRSVQDKAGQDS